MKSDIFYRFVSIIFIIVSSFILVFTFVEKEINVYLTYASIFVLSASLTFILIISFSNRKIKKMKWLEQRHKLWNSISYRVRQGGEAAFNELPIGIVVFSNKKVIQWANKFAREIFLSPLVDRNIEVINQDLFYNLNNNEIFDINIYGRIFSCKVLKEQNIIYFTDKTDMKKLESKYLNRTMAMGIINLDNLTQALVTFDAQNRAAQISNIIGILSAWCNAHQIYLKGYSETQYLILMDYSQLQEVITEEFKVLDEIKGYCLKEDLRSSASIGIACIDLGYNQLFDIAKNMLDFALNRGGNQCVVNIDNDIKYYGGKTNSFENRSPVYVKSKSEELQEIIKKYNKVYVMAHIDADADAFGACLAMYKFILALDKKVKIVLDKDKVDETVLSILEIIEKQHVGVLEYFIKPHDAISRISKEDLLVIVDTQNRRLLLDEKLYNKANHIAIIDHHRPGVSPVDKHEFMYTSTSASSSVELVVEMFEFLQEDVDVSSSEATWMIMGIMVDTNNLLYRASYRTFNVLSRLQKYGGEIQKAHKFLREDYLDYGKKLKVLSNFNVIDEKYGIAVVEDKVVARQFLAKISDEILSIKDIKAAFCIGNIDKNLVGISARSLDDTNVQLVMEALGGGGHYNNAACQLKNVSLTEAQEKLKETLKIFEERESSIMKIILTTNVKGKGKKGDIIEIPRGHANFLIRSEQAVIASADNIKELEKKSQEAKKEAEVLENQMRELKEEIENKNVYINVRVGKEGKLFGAVTMKMIVEEYKKQHNIALDKRKIIFEGNIDSVGTFEIPIQLHKDIKANLIVHVVEQQ